MSRTSPGSIVLPGSFVRSLSGRMRVFFTQFSQAAGLVKVFRNKHPGRLWQCFMHCCREITRNFPGNFPEIVADISRTCPENFRENSWNCPGHFSDISQNLPVLFRKCPGHFLGISRKFPGHVPGAFPEISRKCFRTNPGHFPEISRTFIGQFPE